MGKLIIEDILGDFNLNELLKEANKFSSNIKILDLRDTTKTEDSIIIEIQNDLGRTLLGRLEASVLVLVITKH
jgi:hypothetical protein